MYRTYISPIYLYLLSNRDSAIAFSDRVTSGVVGEQLWLQIKEPTEKDMGKYAIEFNDGKGGLRRTVELAGQGETARSSGLNMHIQGELNTCAGSSIRRDTISI